MASHAVFLFEETKTKSINFFPNKNEEEAAKNERLNQFWETLMAPQWIMEQKMEKARTQDAKQQKIHKNNLPFSDATMHNAVIILYLRCQLGSSYNALAYGISCA